MLFNLSGWFWQAQESQQAALSILYLTQVTPGGRRGLHEIKSFLSVEVILFNSNNRNPSGVFLRRLLSVGLGCGCAVRCFWDIVTHAGVLNTVA